MRNATRTAFLVLLLACASLPARAATATVYAHVENLHEPLAMGPGNTSCSTNNIVRQCYRLLDQALLVTDPDGVSVDSQFYRDVFTQGNTTGVPNFIFTGSANALALPGSLHASVEVQINGKGGTDIYTPPGISGFGFVAIEDQIKVLSSTLAKGTAVTLNTLLDITGEGPGTLFLDVRGKRNGISNAIVFSDTHNASAPPRRIEDIGGSFTAYVGETLNIEYSLRASAGASRAGWSEIDVLNGKAEHSAYGNSAFLYFSAADPAAGVVIDGVGGHDYLLPVPEPGMALMLMLGLGVVGLGARQRRRGARAGSSASTHLP